MSKLGKKTPEKSYSDNHLPHFFPFIGAICVVMVAILLLPISSVIRVTMVGIIVGLLVAFLIVWKNKG